MMKRILTIVTLLIGFSAFCQNEDRILFEKASTLTETYNLAYNEYYDQLNKETSRIFEDAFTKRALEYLNEILTKYPNSVYYTSAIFSKGELEYQSKNNSGAKQNLQEVVNRKDATKQQLSYANLYLTHIFILEKDFKMALNYLEKHAQFPGPIGCGNAIEIHWTRIENLRKTCLENLGK